jgi:hypothetical protein
MTTIKAHNPWQSLTPISDKVRKKRINTDSPDSLYWGLYYDNSYIFIWETKLNNERYFANIIGKNSDKIEILAERFNDKDEITLILKLRSKDYWNIFEHLCIDIYNNIRYYKDDIQKLDSYTKRIKAWKGFFKESKNKKLSLEQIKGLLGELYFLYTYLAPKYGLPNSIDCWTGPIPHKQDFNTDKIIFEIKTHMATSPYVKISSKEQLTLIDDNRNLYLVKYTLSPTKHLNDASFDLNHLINVIRQKLPLSHLEVFNDLLDKAGYKYDKSFDQHRFRISPPIFYKINEDFPRIDSNKIHDCIESVTYCLPVSAIQRYSIDETPL